jgi:pyruvate dehydrogenase E1 component alpha subunit
MKKIEDIEAQEAKLSKESTVEIYRKMLEIRKFEEKVSELWATGMLPGLIHLCIGQEAVPVGVCSTLRKDDYVVSTHRGHGHCIAKGAKLDRMMAELLGKETGYCRGRGGSMHIGSKELGIIGTIGVVGADIPIASGVGYSIKVRGTDQVCACFFGDGASNTGAFHEGLNLSAVWKLPVVFVCENNQYAISMHVSKSTAVRDIAARAAAYDIPGVVVDGMDILAVRRAAEKAVKRARDGGGPSLIECKTYRFRGHYEGDLKRGGRYRSEDEIKQWEEKCPIKNFGSKLIKMNVSTEKELAEIELDVEQLVENAVKFAKDSPTPDPSTLLDNIFAAEGGVKG